MDCKLSRQCKKYNTEYCNDNCYPYVFTHGSNGNGGVWASTNVPLSYRKYLAETMPIKNSSDNRECYLRFCNYIENIERLVLEDNIGIYLFGGTGVGKTTTAVTILNEYVIERVRLHLKGKRKIDKQVGHFIKSADLQNIYNSQFRGNVEVQNNASAKYYRYKDIMMTAELLVIDDIATRDTTESFKNELFEIIDHRAINNLTTIFTSNESLKDLPKYVGDRIASRIEGMTKPMLLKGKDNRLGGLWNGK